MGTNQAHLKVLMIDASNTFYKIVRYKLGNFYGAGSD